MAVVQHGGRKLPQLRIRKKGKQKNRDLLLPELRFLLSSFPDSSSSLSEPPAHIVQALIRRFVQLRAREAHLRYHGLIARDRGEGKNEIDYQHDLAFDLFLHMCED